MGVGFVGYYWYGWDDREFGDVVGIVGFDGVYVGCCDDLGGFFLWDMYYVFVFVGVFVCLGEFWVVGDGCLSVYWIVEFGEFVLLCIK